MSILLNNNGYGNDTWEQMLSKIFPEKQIHVFPNIKDLSHIRDEIKYAVVWNHPPGDLAKYPNLKAILLLGAGTESIDNDPSTPSVPIVRLIDPEVIKDMALYSLYWVMHFHRLLSTYKAQQKKKLWQRYEVSKSQEYKVTVLGLGAVGKEVAHRLQQNGYHVNGWDKFSQLIDNIECHYADEGLFESLKNTNIVINCLPLNKHTYHMINADFITSIPKGGVIINISRGAIINQDDLLESLEHEHLAHAVLDVFEIEPLKESSPLWNHPKVTVTPHISGATYARSAAKLVADNIKRLESDEKPFPLYEKPKINSVMN